MLWDISSCPKSFFNWLTELAGGSAPKQDSVFLLGFCCAAEGCAIAFEVMAGLSRVPVGLAISFKGPLLCTVNFDSGPKGLPCPAGKIHEGQKPTHRVLWNATAYVAWHAE